MKIREKCGKTVIASAVPPGAFTERLCGNRGGKSPGRVNYFLNKIKKKENTIS